MLTPLPGTARQVMFNEILSSCRQSDVLEAGGIQPVLAARGVGQALLQGVRILDVDVFITGIDMVDADAADLGDLLQEVDEDDV